MFFILYIVRVEMVNWIHLSRTSIFTLSHMLSYSLEKQVPCFKPGSFISSEANPPVHTTPETVLGTVPKRSRTGSMSVWTAKVFSEPFQLRTVKDVSSERFCVWIRSWITTFFCVWTQLETRTIMFNRLRQISQTFTYSQAGKYQR